MKRIAIEEHWSNQDLTGLRQEWGSRTGYPATLDPRTVPQAFVRMSDFEKFRLPLMDQYGITLQVLSTSSPGVQGGGDVARAIAVAKKTNDYQAEIISKYPERFAGFASLPTQDPGAAAAELERAVKLLEFKGALIHGSTDWEYLDETKYWPIWERAEALQVPIYLHVNEPSFDSARIYTGHPELVGPTWAWGVETATHALRIIGAGVFDAFPKATLILGHLGESLPYLLGRLDEGYAMAFKNRKLKKRLSDYIQENILITTSGKYRPEALTCAISAIGADRILFANDYPFVEPKESVELFESTPLSNADRGKISYSNAERWLKL